MKNKTFTLDFWAFLLVFFAIVGVICFFPSWFIKSGEIDFTNTGQIGDTIGGIMGPFIAIAASFLTFLAFWVQYKANVQQRNDIALERFESNLFELIHIQQDITNNLSVLEIENEKEALHIRGIDSFQYLYKYYNFGEFNKNPQIGIIAGVECLMKKGDVEDYTELEELKNLDYYFLHLYRVIKYIDTSKVIDENQKYEYVCIVRASLSQFELIMLFYNCLSSNGNKKFKPLIEKYALFNNLRVDLLAKVEHKALYAEGAYEKKQA